MKPGRGRFYQVCTLVGGATCLVFFIIPRKAPQGDYDLAIAEFSYVPVEVTEADPVTFTYTIINKGTSTIPKQTWRVDLYVDGQRVSYDHATSDLAPGEHGTTYSMSSAHHHWKPINAGTYRYRLVLDEKNQAKERDETNNILEGTIEVKSRPSADKS